MPVLMLVAAVVILAGVVVVASGRGGEMVTTAPDYPPIDLGPVTSADVALLRPPSAAWGYNMRVTDEALEVIAKAVTERDVQIAALEQEVSDLRGQLGGGGGTVTRDRPGRDPAPAGPQVPEPDWPSDADADDTTLAGSGVPITRPQPVYHAGDQGQPADEVHFGPVGDTGQAGASAPWGPAEPPAQEPLWEPPHQPAASPAISWEAPEAAQAPEAAEPAEAPQAAEPAAEAAHEPAAEPTGGWSADPADTSPDASPVDPSGPGGPGAPGGQTSVPVTPATGWRAPEPSVWEVASQQVDQDQDQNQDRLAGRSARQEEGPAQGLAQADRTGSPPEFHWDEDPHQRVVWGAEHARAKAARATEETLPNADHSGDRD